MKFEPGPVLAIGTTLIGLVTILSAMHPEWHASATLSLLPVWAAALMGVFMLVGGLATTLSWSRKRASSAWAWRQAGPVIAAPGLVTYAVAAGTNPTFSYLLPAILAAVLLVGLWAVRIQSRHEETQIRKVFHE